MKIISWNIKSIKSWSQTDGVFDFLEKENSDILFAQELKSPEEKMRKGFSNIFSQFPF